MTVRQAWGAFVIGLIVLIVSLFIKTEQIRREEEAMKILTVPIEVTDTQYLALESISLYDAQQAAQIIANQAVIDKANEHIRSFGSTTDFLLTEAEEAISEASAAHSASKEAVKELEAAVPKYDPMPRTTSIFNAETADAEAAVLLDDKLNARKGVHNGPAGKETWYNLDMAKCVEVMRSMGYDDTRYPEWVREDGVKMFGAYVMCAADTNWRPKGSTVATSLGIAIVVDHCVRAETEPGVDIAVTW